MNPIILTGIVIGVLMILAAFLVSITVKYIIDKVYVPMKYKTMNLTTEELFNEFALIIQHVCDMYDRDIFENKGRLIVNDKDFEIYFREICNRVNKAIPEEFYDKFAYYMDPRTAKEFAVQFIRAYLEKQISD